MRRLVLVSVVLGLLAGPALACLWDYDTLKMERQQFPDALELITGKFLRHGEAFYRWRIADREQRLAQTPDDLALVDDLAVAYEKVGETQKAIALMLDKAQKKPGVYETEANLGTFYIHAGEYEQGLAHIRKALEINPEAHFGREWVQQWLVQYVRVRRAAGATLPLDPKPQGHGARGFAAWLLEQRGAEDAEDEDAELAAAVKGVLGMMRFGNFDSPVLLEALGDLLLAGVGNYEGAARRLACRAYLRAAPATEGEARAAYRAIAGAALSMQTRQPGSTATLTLEEVEASLQKEIAAAEAFHAKVVADEERWIRAGENPEARFDETYYGEAPTPSEAQPGEHTGTTLHLLLIVAATILVISGASYLLTRRR